MQIQTLNISLPQNLVKEADRVADNEYKTRSELIKDALMKYLQDKAAWEQIFAAGERSAKKLGVKNEEEVYKIVNDYRHRSKSDKNRT